MTHINLFGVSTKKQVEREMKFRDALRNCPPTEIKFRVNKVSIKVKKGDQLRVELPKFNPALYIITSKKGKHVVATFKEMAV